MKYLTEKEPIRQINTVDVRITEDEAYLRAERGILTAFRNTSNPCITKILAEARKAVKQSDFKPIIDR